MRTIKVEDAESGRLISIRMDVGDMSINRLKNQLALFVSVPPQDQIILIGPPYKLLETQFGSDFIQHEDQRVFLYNRLIFSPSEDNSKRQIPDFKLTPFEISSIVENIGDLSKEIAQLVRENSSPLFTALVEFERKFLSHLKRGETLLQVVDESYRSVCKCCDEQLIQRDALHAALSHFKDDFNNMSMSFNQAKKKIIDQQIYHGKILASFDQDLLNLSQIPISSSLRRVRKDRLISNDSNNRSSNNNNNNNNNNNFSNSTSDRLSLVDLQPPSISSSPSAGDTYLGDTLNDPTKPRDSVSSQQYVTTTAGTPTGTGTIGTMMMTETLYDCVPVDKERVWANQCRSVHSKVEDTLKELDTIYENIMILVNKLEDPTIDFNNLIMIKEKINNHLHIQQSYMDQLRIDYQYVYDIITSRAQPTGTTNTNISAATNTITTPTPTTDHSFDSSYVSTLEILESKRKEHDQLLMKMYSLCEETMQLKSDVAKSKIEMTKCLFSRITLIAVIQTDVQKMMERLFQMKKWYKGRNEYFAHLEHVARLPEAYEAFLREIIRRQSYHSLLQSKISSFTANITQLRANETNYRKEFMQTCGRNLPPSFLEMVPSLMQKPPYYEATASDIPVLPNITEDDINTLKGYLHTSDENMVSKSYEETLLQIFPKSRAQGRDYNDGSVIFEPAIPELSFGDQISRAQYHELEYENALLKANILELSRQLSKRSDGLNMVDTIAVGTTTTTNNTTTNTTTTTTTAMKDSNLTMTESRNEKSNHEATAVNSNNDNTLENVITTLVGGFYTIKATFLNEILQRANESSSNLLSLISEDNLSTEIPEAQVVDIHTAKTLVDKITALTSQFKNVISRGVAKEIRDLNVKNQQLEDELESRNRLDVLTSTTESGLDTIQTSRSTNMMRSIESPEDVYISVANFVENTIALFIYRNPQTYIAFHVNCPHRYLSEESINSIKQSRGKFPRDFIIGRVIFSDRRIASSEENPFELSIGTEYFLLTVEDLTTPLQKSIQSKSPKSRKEHSNSIS